jgi:hypothetical protein
MSLTAAARPAGLTARDHDSVGRQRIVFATGGGTQASFAALWLPAEQTSGSSQR